MTPATEKESIQKQVVELIYIMNAAITNLRLYPPTNPLIVNSIEKLQKSLITILEKKDSVEYAESEKTLLVQGEALPEKEQAKTQVSSFLKVMLDLGIRSIAFKKGVTGEEIAGFLQSIGKSSREIENAGGLNQIFNGRGISHIKIDEKIYVGVDSERSIAATMDIKDEDITRLIMGEKAESSEAQDLMRELVKDPEWVSRVFQAGVKQVMQETQNFLEADLSEKFSEMITSLNRISGRDKTEITKAILSSLPDMDDQMLLAVISQNLDAVFGEDMFSNYLEQMADDEFNRLFSKIRKIAESIPKDDKETQHQSRSIDQILQLMVHSAKAKGLIGKDEPPSEAAETLEAPGLKMLQGMANTVEKLISKGSLSAITALFDQFSPLLRHKDSEVRSAVAEMMSHIDEKLEESGLLEERIELSRKLSEWIKFETVISPVYEKITGQLERLSRQLIENDRSEDADHILEAYSLIYSKNLTKEEAIQALAANMLQNLATDDILNLLLKETQADGTKKKKDDTHSLIILGTTSIERLLDRLHDSHNRVERNRIIQVITKIGKPAIPPIIERLYQKGPWYYTRNLALLIGRIGSPVHVEALVSLVGGEDTRIQREVVFAIGNLGGNAAGNALVESLDSADDDIKGLMISVLGTLKYREAVPVLINLLETKAASINKKLRNDIMIKACEALARIGENEAVPALEKVKRSKGFLALKAYDPAVRSAAVDALGKLRNT